jgi:hypothetical protein
MISANGIASNKNSDGLFVHNLTVDDFLKPDL